MLEQLIIQFGYVIVILGTFFEGEGILIFFGYLAQRDFLNIILVIVFGFFGTIFFDTLLFLLGYIKGESIILKIPGIKPDKIFKVKKLVKRYDTTYILVYRFIFGARIVSLLILGTGRVKISKFILYNSLVALLWTLFFTLSGYFLGKTFQKTLDNFILEFVIITVILVSIIYFFKKMYTYFIS